ncbi:receptor-like serine/threonine-protein kinase SD1-8 [Iris pallida]|uniref:Receptor-like serine/threonine-protein kinase SD1-8 n=1 Tax=Iris pallida TaxID=29817 RepID=A0AAX6FCI4_IRIPA|nr:receptor-like serine/threonine-protein kinase SD1-8 [Iris pallida]
MIQIRSSCPVLLLVLVMTLFSHSLPPATARDTVTPTQPLLDNQTLISSGGRFALGFFSPAAGSASRYVGIWYNNMSARRVVWVANRARPVPGPTGLLSVTANGTMVITDAESNSTVWSMAGRTTAPAVAQLLDNGNFVIRGSAAAEGNYAWQSFEHPTDTMLAGMQLGLNWTTGLSLNLTSWRNADDPAVGSTTCPWTPTPSYTCPLRRPARSGAAGRRTGAASEAPASTTTTWTTAERRP